MQLFDTRHGPLYAFPGDRYLGEAISLYGEYSEYEYQSLSDLSIHSGMFPVIVEIGANAGYLTIPLAKNFSIYAFEPQPSVFHVLKRNNELNGNRAIIQQIAIGDTNGEIDCPKEDYSPYCQMGSNQMGLSEDSIKVPLRTLDSFYYSPTLLKIDVEGMEYEVLQGAKDTITKSRPIIYCENDRPEKSEQLLKCLFSLKYKVYWQCPVMYNPGNYYGNLNNIYFGQYSFNLACIPEERDIPEEIKEKHGMRLITSSKDQIRYDPKTGLVTL